LDQLVSIITPSFNSGKFISETIQSVLNQTYSNWEMIITDDCSGDNTVEIIEQIVEKDSRIRLYRFEKNKGSGPARNNSIKKAKGKYLAFLDSDDIWVPNKLEKQLKFLEENNISFSHSSYGFLDESGNEIRKPFIVSKKPVGYKELLKRTEISCLTAIYNQEEIGKMYMPDLRKKQDYALWLSILKTGVKSFPQADILAFYRQRKTSATSKKHQLIFKHYFFLRTQENLTIYASLHYTFLWIVNGLLKYYL